MADEVHECNGREFRLPTFPMIGHKQAQQLYANEERAMDWIKKAARELSEVLHFDESEFWTHAMPEELATILESFEKGAAEAAAIAYLRKAGFTVERP